MPSVPRGRRAARRLATVPAALLACALLACVRVPPADLSRDPAALLDQVRAAQARVQRVRGTARVRVDSPTLSGTVTEFIAAEKPDRLHLETLDFFGNPAAVLVASGGRFAFLDAKAGVFYRGDATPENVSRLLPVAIPADELVTILCGSAPLLEGTPLDATPRGAFLLLTLGEGEVGQQVAIGDRATVAWSRVRTARPPTPGGAAPGYDLEFGTFRESSGERFPTEVKLDASAARSRVELTWRDDLELNASVAPALFQMDAPKGARVVDLPRGAPIPDVELPIEGPRE